MLAVPRIAAADTATDGARHVRRIADRVAAILRDGRLDRARAAARLETVLAGQIDVRYLGRFLIGRWWFRLSPADRAAYLWALPRYLVHDYAQRLVRNRAVTLVVKRAEATGHDTVTVVTNVIDPSDSPPLVVKWRLYRTAHGFRVRDLVVQNFSMALNLRREFAAILRRHDGQIAGLIAKLRGSGIARHQKRRAVSG